MYQTANLDYIEGYLCVKTRSFDSEKPIAYVSYYPIEKAPRYYAERYLGDDFIGREVCIHDVSDLWMETQDPYRKYRLINGGQTMPIRTDQEIVAPPKVRKGIEVRWHWGKWEKYTQRDGWIAAY